MDYKEIEEWEDEGWEETEEDEYLYGDSELVPCPSCGSDIYEDSERCPACGEYIVFSHHPLEGWPSWAVALGLLGVLAVLFAMIL